MYHYYFDILPSSFKIFFQTVASTHSYNSRLPSKPTYYINTNKTNYHKFNIRFAAAKVWKHLGESIKRLPIKTFKNKAMLNISQSSYILTVHEFSTVLYLFILFLFFFLTINKFLCSSFTANLPSIFKHYFSFTRLDNLFSYSE